MPVNNSTNGYFKDIGLLHREHFPPKKKKLTIGIFSNHLMGFLHFGQKEPGLTMDLPIGKR